VTTDQLYRDHSVIIFMAVHHSVMSAMIFFNQSVMGLWFLVFGLVNVSLGPGTQSLDLGLEP